MCVICPISYKSFHIIIWNSLSQQFLVLPKGLFMLNCVHLSFGFTFLLHSFFSLTYNFSSMIRHPIKFRVMVELENIESTCKETQTSGKRVPKEESIKSTQVVSLFYFDNFCHSGFVTFNLTLSLTPSVSFLEIFLLFNRWKLTLRIPLAHCHYELLHQ